MNITVIARPEGSKQSRFSSLDCFVASLLAMTERLGGFRVIPLYILGVRLRQCKEVRQEIITGLGRADTQRGLREGFLEVVGERTKTKDPSPLQVKEVVVGTHRYILCYNPEQARKDAFDRTQIVEKLQSQLTLTKP